MGSAIIKAGKVIPQKILMQLRKKKLSADSLISEVNNFVDSVDDPRRASKRISMHDHLMCGLSIFIFKQPTLAAYNEMTKAGNTSENIERIFSVENIPSDTSIREMLDEIDVSSLNPLFPRLFTYARSHGALEDLRCFEGGYIIALDGTGFYSSKKVHCDRCLEKHHKDGSITYHHQMVAGVLIKPGEKSVFPIGFEEIKKQDGSEKNDCERNAASRFLTRIRNDYPKTKFTVVEDGLSSNAPHIEKLLSLDFSFILVAKPGDHKFLFKEFNAFIASDSVDMHEYVDSKQVTHSFLFKNDIPLNESNQKVRVNFLSYWTTDKNGKELYNNTWVTNLELSHKSVIRVAEAGRARWKIENETFNTLKNNGYNLEHNFGHGYKNLAGVFVFLTLIAFMIDQIRLRWCSILACLKYECKSQRITWGRQLNALFKYAVASMTELIATLLADVTPKVRRNTG